VNFGTENWTHAFAQNGPTQATIAIVAWDMRSRRTLLWKMILPAAALKGRKACAQLADARAREIGKQALSGPFAGMKAPLDYSVFTAAAAAFSLAVMAADHKRETPGEISLLSWSTRA
jgi:hypothetical protein